MAARRPAKAPKLDDLAGQTDAKAPLDWQLFLKSAQPVLKLLQDDLRARAKTSAAVADALKARHAAERDNKRTADSFVEWQDHFIEQVAAAWLLSCVFVRTIEDRGLLGHNRLAGSGAADSLKLFLDLAPSLNERDYLLTIFRELTRFPATKALFDSRHNPVWLLTPSAEGAKALVQLFQQPRADVPAFRFGQSDTGFLGWLYQDLDAGVRERFALLQTPRFIEAFILDRTLEPAIAKFGLDDTTLIDPTCGSGHFLLGAFERLFDHRLRKEPGLSTRDAATKALKAVFGSDINPYAVGIARFRLTLAFLDKAGFTNLATAPALPLHVVVGDSLLHNPHVSQPDFADLAPSTKDWRGEEFALEDEAAAREVLHRKYATVVGNPPYITVKDAVLREEYRKMYPRAAAGKYSIAAPFTERFFQLGRTGARVGMITANSFMKREFGKKLIEQSLPAVNLDLVINTSGAYIPGHGTPTVLLFGGAEPPQGAQVATVLASRGEPSTPDDPEEGLVWRSIADHWSEAGFENEFITVGTTERTVLAQHPWSLGGGGAAELKELLEERAEKRLGDVTMSIGFMVVVAEDDCFLAPRHVFERARLKSRPVGIGELVRDWSVAEGEHVLFDYSDAWQHQASPAALKYLWPYRDRLSKRLMFGKTQVEAGNHWSAYRHVGAEKVRTPLSLTFAFVATHNHFALDAGRRVFGRTAPIIKLPDTAIEDDHLALLAYLNSSTACFWMKQVCHNKTNASQKHHTDPARAAYEFAGTALEQLPLPPRRDDALVSAARELSELARQRSRWVTGEEIRADYSDFSSDAAIRSAIHSGWASYEQCTQRAAYLQEEIDWRVYAAFGLSSSVNEPIDADAAATLGSRPFEVNTGYSAGVSDRVRREGSASTGHLLPAWRHRQLELEKPGLRVIESREFKRMWRDTEQNIDQTEFREKLPAEWLRICLLDEIEAATQATVFGPRGAISAVDAKRLAAVSDFLGLTAEVLVDELLVGASVPFLAPLRFTDVGLERYAEWERTWDDQRREDAGERVHGIPLPPKYGQGDYRSTTTWQLRGPLDVPKERFISYPGCESDQDREPVYGWAGWDHEQRARALATLYVNRRDEESWTKDRLTPMLAGLLELVPWLKQWHGEPSEDYAGVSPGEYYEGFLDDECRKHGLTLDDLRQWRPAEKRRGKKAVAPAAPADARAETADAAPKKRGRKSKAAKATEEEGAAE